MNQGGRSSYRELFVELAIAMTPVWIFLGIFFVANTCSSNRLDEPPLCLFFIGPAVGALAILGIIRIVNRRRTVKPPSPNPDDSPVSDVPPSLPGGYDAGVSDDANDARIPKREYEDPRPALVGLAIVFGLAAIIAAVVFTYWFYIGMDA